MKLPNFENRQWYQTEINTIEELEKLVINTPIGNDIYYRGMANYDFICISTFYRYYLQTNPDLIWTDMDVGFNTKIPLPKIDPEDYQKLSLNILEEFYSHLLNQGSRKLSFNSIAYLAQHYGLPTNLIDFTIDPKVALFFACSEFPDKDCVLYKYDIYAHIKNLMSFFRQGHAPIVLTNPDGSLMTDLQREEWVRSGLTKLSPDSKIATPIIKPEDISYGQRIINQKGSFVYHNEVFPFDQVMYTVSPETGFYGRRVYKISTKIKTEILNKLEKEGINHEFLYPAGESDRNLEIITSAVAATRESLAVHA